MPLAAAPAGAAGPVLCPRQQPAVGSVQGLPPPDGAMDSACGDQARPRCPLGPARWLPTTVPPADTCHLCACRAARQKGRAGPCIEATLPAVAARHPPREGSRGVLSAPAGGSGGRGGTFVPPTIHATPAATTAGCRVCLWPSRRWPPGARALPAASPPVPPAPAPHAAPRPGPQRQLRKRGVDAADARASRRQRPLLPHPPGRGPRV